MYWARKTLAITLASFFLGGIFLCIGMTSMAHAGMQPSDMHCAGADCSPSFDHASYWNHILTGIPSDFFGAMAALVIASVCLWIAGRTEWKLVLKRLLSPSAVSPPLGLLPRHALQEAFANGILHPKLYRYCS